MSNQLLKKTAGLSPFTFHLKTLSLHRGKNWIKLKFLRPIFHQMLPRSLAAGSTTLNVNLKFHETATVNLATTGPRTQVKGTAFQLTMI